MESKKISSEEFKEMLKRAHLSTSPSKHIQELSGKYAIVNTLDLRGTEWLREVPAVIAEKSATLSYTPKLYSVQIQAGESIYLSGSGITRLMQGTTAGKNDAGIGLDIEFCENLDELTIVTPGMVNAAWAGITRIHPSSKIGKNDKGVSLVAKRSQLKELNMEFPGSVDISGISNITLGDRFYAHPDQAGVSIYASECPKSMPPRMANSILAIGGKQTVWSHTIDADQFEVEIF